MKLKVIKKVQNLIILKSYLKMKTEDDIKREKQIEDQYYQMYNINYYNKSFNLYFKIIAKNKNIILYYLIQVLMLNIK